MKVPPGVAPFTQQPYIGIARVRRAPQASGSGWLQAHHLLVDLSQPLKHQSEIQSCELAFDSQNSPANCMHQGGDVC